ncbi:glycogen synthase GlgA [Ruminococcus sp.]|uniref:glycogen synthase GlgA n=1 Tax=Ruminococcus sp. TaxID=41978 RepID=UPI0025E2D852|nr:glycogen synthase GlgA [Ruminococcus sp.]MCI5816158.1 glycogen synthase GlgA [Ruminococcus sp.]MDD7556701.1 glycogen synthase GlgA [Ruminococcus sp.]
MNILFAASEALPYAASGGLADVAGSLPAAIVDKGHDCRVVIPLYKCISGEMRDSLTFLTNITVDVSWRKQYCGIFTGIYKGVTYYFIDNEYYFGRDGIYGFYDDCERFVFYSRAVLEMIRCIDFKPDIIHANDWQAAMIPVYYQIFYKYQQGYENIHTVFTIHNIQYQGKYGKEVLNELMGIPLYHTGLLEYDGCVNMMKGAIETADKITTVSPSYAWEILDPWYSHGLDRALNTKQYKLCGFLNGIDVDGYNPETDPAIPANYSLKDMAGKAKCKQALLEELRLQDGDEPIIGIVTRFVSHKGIDLIRYVFEDILNLGYKFAILGSGEKIFEDFFKEMAWRHPGRVSVTLGFVPQLARRIYAGADMFLMPSQSEPCGLAQMVAMRYGTLPIVRETGGLRDTVRDGGGENGNGFTFKTYNAHDMLGACNRARNAYKDQERWKTLQRTAMEGDFSWNTSAELYMGLYRELVERH